MEKNTKTLTLDLDPFDLFYEWYSLAEKEEINDPNAMNLSTVDKGLQPSSRIVLMKFFDKRGFVFNTNLNSKKAIEILNNPNVTINFHWKSLLKQVRIEGYSEKINEEEANSLFDVRPENSKIGAWASDQSSVLKNRKELEDKVKNFQEKYKGKKIPRPSYWSGYRIVPNLFEFWQQGPFRLHERVEYIKIKESWIAKYLYP